MKRILLIIILHIPLITCAQLWSVGGKVGTTFSNYKTQTPWKEVSNMGFDIGVTGFKQIKPNWGLNLELHYIQKGYYHKICNDITDQLQANYLEVPVMIDYTIVVPSLQNWKTHLNLGVYAAYWMSGKYKMKGFDTSSEEFDFEKNDASRFDFGPNGGARIEYLLKGNSSLSLDFRYEMGVIDLQKKINDNTKNTNRTMIVGLSYMKLLSK
jgi:hypothetical protein